MNTKSELVKKLNADTKEKRLSALKELMELYNSGTIETPARSVYVNNHVHTAYSFSPYSPTSAAYTAWESGLDTVGIMDHDSVAGAHEFVEAGKIIGVATTCGLECRCDNAGTLLHGKRSNSPDQTTITYLAAHGIPHQNIDRVQAWMTTYRLKREERNKKMVDNINDIIANSGIILNYEKDVRAISNADDGGSVTERHILYGLSNKIVSKFGKGTAVLDFLEKELNIIVEGKSKELLSNPEDEMYNYYLLGLLKSNMVSQFYIDATDECPKISDFVEFITSVGAIPVYPYLGDVGDSVTGDKKTQTFEDSYLDQLIQWLPEAGFKAVAFMPTRNTKKQLERLMTLCKESELFQISGEDINTPFQSFICKALDEPEYEHLIKATWALIGHEKVASESLENGMFTQKTVAKLPKLQDRIDYFEKIGRLTLQEKT